MTEKPYSKQKRKRRSDAKTPQENRAAIVARRREKGMPGRPKRDASQDKIFSTHVPRPLIARIKTTVAVLGLLLPDGMTITTFTEQAFAEHLRKLEKKHNDGQPFAEAEKQV